MQLPKKITEIIKILSRWPGVGEKTATRYTLSLLKWNAAELQSLSSAIVDLLSLKKCKECGFFSENEICELCLSAERTDTAIICVVESVADCLAIEKSGEYKGVYHILGGVLSPL
ncbi:MAG: toprim domain-containing protein, partial [Oligoflexia bacterium]|nr:toprim domain-containing protein [Oligoflexia bacterium]